MHGVMSALGRLLPVRATQRAGQTRCKRLVKSNANVWSGGVQLPNGIPQTAGAA